MTNWISPAAYAEPQIDLDAECRDYVEVMEKVRREVMPSVVDPELGRDYAQTASSILVIAYLAAVSTIGAIAIIGGVIYYANS